MFHLHSYSNQLVMFMFAANKMDTVVRMRGEKFGTTDANEE